MERGVKGGNLVSLNNLILSFQIPSSFSLYIIPFLRLTLNDVMQDVDEYFKPEDIAMYTKQPQIINRSLGAATINAANDTTGVASYIEACTCEGFSFICHNNALVPNATLIVCIRIKDYPPDDVEIDFLETMVSATAIYDIW